MIKFVLFVVFIVSMSFAQDTGFCNQNDLNPVQPELEFKVLSNFHQYQMTVEGNSGLRNDTSEMHELYDSIRNITVSRVNTSTKSYSVYNYYAFNQAYVILGKKCSVLPADDPSIPTVIDNLKNIIDPIHPLLSSAVVPGKVVYIGTSIVRGINVNQWQTCYYDTNSLTTKKITYSISIPNAWDPVQMSRNVSEVPVEIITNNKKGDTVWTDTYTITRFRTDDSVDPDFWTTPSGVYCQNRVNKQKEPTMPVSFILSGQITSPSNEFDGIVSHTNRIREVFNYQRKMSRRDYTANSYFYTQIADFYTGLEYEIERTNGSCLVYPLGRDDIDAAEENNYIIMKKDHELFDYDSLNVQYVGQRHVNNVPADVWIGLGGNEFFLNTYEWYFEINNNINSEIRKPIALFINSYDVQDQTDIPIYYYFNDFLPNAIDIDEFDISTCTSNFTSKRFGFTFKSGEQAEILMQNQHLFKKDLLFAMEKASFIPAIRIFNMEITYRSNNIYIYFSMLEKADLPVLVENSDSISLDNGANLLKSVIEKDNFYVTIVVANGLNITVKADSNSFHEVMRRSNIIPTSNGVSNGTVAAIAIILCLVGIIIGAVVTMYKDKIIKIVYRRSQEIQKKEDVISFTNQNKE